MPSGKITKNKTAATEKKDTTTDKEITKLTEKKKKEVSMDQKLEKIQKLKADRIKAKLSGKNYSPLVAKVKSASALLQKKGPISKKAKKVEANSSSDVKKEKQKATISVNKKAIKKIKQTLKNEDKQVVTSKKQVKLNSMETEPETKSIPKNKKTKLNDPPLIVTKNIKENSAKKKSNALLEVKAKNIVNPAKTTLKKKIKTKDSPLTKAKNIKVNSVKSNLKKIGLKYEKGLKKVLLKTTDVENNAEKGLLDSKTKANSATIICDEKDTETNSSITGLIPKIKTDKSLTNKTSKLILRTRKNSVKAISKIKTLKKRTPQKSLKIKKGQGVKIKRKDNSERGVCYFSRIPHGFYEKQLKDYCSQFGKVTGVYHPVSKRGHSNGYAFVEFLHTAVAEVVAETMNNYLMFNRLVKCEYIAPEYQKPYVFKRRFSNKEIADKRTEEALVKQMKTLTPEEEEKKKAKSLTYIKKLHEKLKSLGVDYKFQVYDGSEKKQVSS